MNTLSKLLPVLLMVSCLAGCMSADKDEQAPILKVDNEHFYLLHTNAPSYRLAPCRGVILDATHYTFNMPALIRGKPLTKICMFGISRTNMAAYQLDWKPGKTRYEISGATLTPSDESPAFGGFESGQEWNIGVYADYGTNKSLAAWYGVIEIQ